MTLTIAIAGCSWGQPRIDFTIENVSDDALEIESMAAPEFAYPPHGRHLSGRDHTSTRFGAALWSAPSQVVVSVKGGSSKTVSVPPLPPDLEGRIALVVEQPVDQRGPVGED